MKKQLLCLSFLAAFLIFPGCAPYQRPPAITEEPPIIAPPPPKPSAPAYKPPIPSAKVPVWTGVKGKTIVVDAGHGGKDPGTLGRYSTRPEKFINLSIATEVADELKSRGAKVIMTRSNDHFVELEERAATADRYHADLFVAIHADASEKRSESGATVYVSRSPSSQSRKAAYAVNSAMVNAGFESNGISQADYKVLVLHSRPAILVECGYLTNYAECRKMNSAAYRDKLASAIVSGVSNYFAR